MFFGTLSAGTVEQQDGVGSAPDGPGDLVEVKLHRIGIGEGRRRCRGPGRWRRTGRRFRSAGRPACGARSASSGRGRWHNRPYERR